MAKPAVPVGQEGGLDAALATPRRGRIAHAHLITGPAGSGKGLFAETVARAQLCAAPADDGMPCGRCEPCRRTVAGTHPDLHWLGSEVKLGIEEVRGITRAAALAPHSAGCSVFVVEACERLTGPAAVALLKTLEEPAGPVLFLMLTEHPDQVEPTLRSRCLQLPMRPVSSSRVDAWLADLLPDLAPARRHAAARDCRGLPGIALRLAQGTEDPLRAAAECLAQALAADSSGSMARAAAELARTEAPPEQVFALLRDWWLAGRGWLAEVGAVSAAVAGAPAGPSTGWPAETLARAGRACLQASEAADANVNSALNWYVLLERLHRLRASC